MVHLRRLRWRVLGAFWRAVARVAGPIARTTARWANRLDPDGECPECAGTGTYYRLVFDNVSDPVYVYACPGCDGIGRVLR